jgi:hypothetical protein
MPGPIALCLENCYPAHESLRYLRCVALSGAEPALSVLPGGEIEWRQETPGHGQLWVSADERLIFHRPAGSVGWAQVHRGGRRVDVPDGKPVVLLDGDHLVVPGFCYRVHVHGPAGQLHEPTYLDAGEPARLEPARHTRGRLAAAGLLAVTTIFGAQGACTTEKPVNEKPEPREAGDPGQPMPPVDEPDEKQPDKPEIDVRDHPPAPLPPDGYRNVRPANETLGTVAPPAAPPIEVRVAPPKPAPPMNPPMKGDMKGDPDEDDPKPTPPMK